MIKTANIRPSTWNKYRRIASIRLAERPSVGRWSRPALRLLPWKTLSCYLGERQSIQARQTNGHENFNYCRTLIRFNDPQKETTFCVCHPFAMGEGASFPLKSSESFCLSVLFFGASRSGRPEENTRYVALLDVVRKVAKMKNRSRSKKRGAVEHSLSAGPKTHRTMTTRGGASRESWSCLFFRLPVVRLMQRYTTCTVYSI